MKPGHDGCIHDPSTWHGSVFFPQDGPSAITAWRPPKKLRRRLAAGDANAWFATLAWLQKQLWVQRDRIRREAGQ